MKSAVVTQRVKTFSEEHCDSSQAGKSEMPDNIVSLVNKRLPHLFHENIENLNNALTQRGETTHVENVFM